MFRFTKLIIGAVSVGAAYGVFNFVMRLVSNQMAVAAASILG